MKREEGETSLSKGILGFFMLDFDLSLDYNWDRLGMVNYCSRSCFNVIQSWLKSVGVLDWFEFKLIQMLAKNLVFYILSYGSMLMKYFMWKNMRK